jgi:hypothetical protein
VNEAPSAKRPYEVASSPRKGRVEPFDAEGLAEAQEEAQDQARVQEKRRGQKDTVAEFLGETFWHADRTWPCLFWPLAGYQLSVKMYFPHLNLAIDKYPAPTDIHRKEAAFKAVALKKAGIRYVALFPETPLRKVAVA